VGLVVLAAIRFAIEPIIPSIGTRIAAAGAVPIWRRASVIFVAAVGEEIVFRLLLLSAVAGVAIRLLPHGGRTRGIPVVWFANLTSAVAFGAAHVPAWLQVAPMEAGLLACVLILNAPGGIVFGYVCVSRGIGFAILAHAAADCVVQFVGPVTG
jgi:membrane protease YdiL (CAAX protease family)